MTTTWNPTPDPEIGHATLAEAVGQALGTASVCWENPAGAGVFDSTACARVYEGLMAYLSDWADEQRRRANEATYAKTHAAVAANIRTALATDEADDDTTSGEAIWEQAGYRRGLATAARLAAEEDS